ncbi:MAG: 1-deoxy-D-xylulose-5-phosphate reductoisomerase [Bacteroidales bacterium]|jgi:1-deoxy-D-xylulose-5-phosphate reductoisomerase|nr:1-deoxy-D-xylulose-5-phosphate reductoisomerase [Bacteroidales bacterium]NLM92268.1 1-deoxy-D-xylulose-5-phosphate reductoisomerase [Bacteroidales bacterium]
MNGPQKKGLAILGATGSIGCQALEVIRAFPHRFQVEVLTAQNNAPRLIRQAIEFQPNAVVIGNEALYPKVKEALESFPIKVFSGAKALKEVTEFDGIDMVLTAMVGIAGLEPTMAAIQAGKQIALANKETLVVAGNLITRLAQEKGVNIYPVDSEHSAIFQCLAGEFHNPLEKIYLTASGGPFRGKKRDFLASVKKEQALKHPNWDMGCKITIDSASMMNKGLEVIEAKWLFALKPDQIKVIVHPQSIVHSLVQFSDGSIKAQMGLPDMKLPILYAMAYPDRLHTSFPRFDFLNYHELNFEAPDTESFPNLMLAYRALEKGGNMPCILNAANEVAVAAFLKDQLGFLQMSDVIDDCMQKIHFMIEPNLQDFIHTDAETRKLALSLIKKQNN